MGRRSGWRRIRRVNVRSHPSLSHQNQRRARLFVRDETSFSFRFADLLPPSSFDWLLSNKTVKVSKANRLRTQLLGRSSTSNDALSGTSTSLSFTPVQGSSLCLSPSTSPCISLPSLTLPRPFFRSFLRAGLEIATPSLSAAERVKAANDRWFKEGTFSHVAGKGAGTGAGGILGKGL